MLSLETVRQFVFQSLIIKEYKDHGYSFRERHSTKSVLQMDVEALATAKKLMADMPYDEMCNKFVEQLKELHAMKLPGIAKRYLADKAAKEDPERFKEVFDFLEREDFGPEPERI